MDPDIGDVIEYEAPWMDPWRRLPLDPPREQALISQLAASAFDAAVIFTSFRQSPLPAAYLCYLAGVPLRLAASIDGPGSLLTTRHKHPERMMHEVERGLDLVRAVGIDTDERGLVLEVPEFARESARAKLAAVGVSRDGPLVVTHPGCSMPARTYPWELYAEVVAMLVERLGATVLVTGAESEIELVDRIVARLPTPIGKRVHGLAGKLTFEELCATIESADITVTNNTGPMHIAAAVKTPVVALFALTNPPEQWGPWAVAHRQLYHEVPCRICYSRVCPFHHECLSLVSPAEVVRAVTALLEESHARAEHADHRREASA
jgi:ADP-heptose:LPS heptosyltransferase